MASHRINRHRAARAQTVFRNQLYLMQQRAFRDSAKMLAPHEIASLFTARITLSKPHQTMPRRELCSRLDQRFLPNF